MRHLPYTLIALAAVSGFASAQVVTTSYTTPVGYITYTLAGNPTANPSGADTYAGPVLVNPVKFAGTTTVNPSGLTTLTFSGGVPALDSKDLIEIKTPGASEGWWSEVVSSTSTTIEVANAIPTVGGNIQIEARKITTIRDFLGANDPGFTKETDGSVPGDQVIFLDPTTQASTTYVYVDDPAYLTPGEDPGWTDFGTFLNGDDVKIYPGTGCTFRIFSSATDKTFVAEGTVKTGKTQVDVFPGDNFIAPTLAVGATFGTLNVASIMFSDDSDPNTTPVEDQVITLQPDQVAVPYVVDALAVPSPLFVRFSDFSDGTGVLVPEGTGFIFRRVENSESVLTFPAQVIATP